MLQIFLSWSKEASHQVAQALAEWIPLVIPEAEPWISDSDIDAGKRWKRELAVALRTCRFGVICITPSSVDSQWLAYEAGAIAAASPDGYVVPVLFEVRPIDLRPPLANFQSVVADQAGMHSLVTSLNDARTNPLAKDELDQAYLKHWPNLKARLNHVPASVAGTKGLSDREILEEILGAVRQSSSRFSRMEYLDGHGRHYAYRIRKHLYAITGHDVSHMVALDLGLLKADIDDVLERVADEGVEARLTAVKQLADSELRRRAARDISGLGTADLVLLIETLRPRIRETQVWSSEVDAAAATLILAEEERSIRFRFGVGPSLS